MHLLLWQLNFLFRKTQRKISCTFFIRINNMEAHGSYLRIWDTSWWVQYPPTNMLELALWDVITRPCMALLIRSIERARGSDGRREKSATCDGRHEGLQTIGECRGWPSRRRYWLEDFVEQLASMLDMVEETSRTRLGEPCSISIEASVHS